MGLYILKWKECYVCGVWSMGFIGEALQIISRHVCCNCVSFNLGTLGFLLCQCVFRSKNTFFTAHVGANQTVLRFRQTSCDVDNRASCVLRLERWGSTI